jgi:hypothetical protein
MQQSLMVPAREVKGALQVGEGLMVVGEISGKGGLPQDFYIWIEPPIIEKVVDDIDLGIWGVLSPINLEK